MDSVFQVNTVYQLFIVINMRLNGIPNGNADLIVTDHTPVLNDYVDNLKQSGLFGNVFYVESLKFNKIFWGIHNDNKYEFYLDGENKLKPFLTEADLDYKKYDCIYLANLDAYSKFIYRYNRHLKIFLFEDGAAICTNDWKSATKKWNYIQGFNDIYDNISLLYLYTPELMCIQLGYEMEKLPRIDHNSSETLSLYNNIFDYDANFTFAPFVFLEEPFQADNIINNDLELMKNIYEEVGYDNFMIKSHPRNSINRSLKLGYGIQKNTPWPFELMFMNNIKKNITYITIDSGSLISTRVLFNADVKTMFLYKIVKGPTRKIAVNEFIQYMDKFCLKYKSKNLLVPYSEYEFRLMLRALREAL